ncbi:MICOS complex subunit MIC25 isoform X2 [Lemur catta]|uniref:MICOS complex subunit MIC25 isoform X2 n=1 Tax=Lemur catta TaxID=9447 RepID=UPI001E26ADCC|nr:MICOS complex subunit MIC25 isoform X2 [Lemur catta]
MGSAGSSEGRRVPFGTDDEERVRVLQGVRLSENVVNRMRDPRQPSEARRPSPAPAAPPPLSCDSREGSLKGPQQESKVPQLDSSGGQRFVSGAKEDLKRYKQDHAAVQDEPFPVAKRDREPATKHPEVSLPHGEGSFEPEKQKFAWQARDLESREAELARRDAFCREQLGRLERKNAEMYKLSSQQFHEAASKMENALKPRRVEPVCARLQAQILGCYRAHLHQVLLCSHLVKAYERCVSAARKG